MDTDDYLLSILKYGHPAGIFNTAAADAHALHARILAYEADRRRTHTLLFSPTRSGMGQVMMTEIIGHFIQYSRRTPNPLPENTIKPLNLTMLAHSIRQLFAGK